MLKRGICGNGEENAKIWESTKFWKIWKRGEKYQWKYTKNCQKMLKRCKMLKNRVEKEKKIKML